MGRAAVVYYAMGGGLGHLVRARALLHTLGLERDATIVTSSPFADDPRVVGRIPVHRFPGGGDLLDVARYRAWLFQTLAALDPDELLIDTFPAGLVGELGDLPRLTGARLTYVGRLLRWPSYAPLIQAGCRLRFTRALFVEPPHPDHGAAIASFTDGDVRALALRDPPPEPPPPLPAGLPERFWLIVHSGPRDEVRELAAYAMDQQRLEGVAEPLVVASPAGAPAGPTEAATVPVDVHPSTPLLPRASRIVTACGFNVMRQTEPYRDRHTFLPFPRRYDDQFTRAARRRG